MGSLDVLSCDYSPRSLAMEPVVVYGLAGICVGLPVGIVIGVGIAFWMVGGVK